LSSVLRDAEIDELVEGAQDNLLPCSVNVLLSVCQSGQICNRIPFRFFRIHWKPVRYQRDRLAMPCEPVL